MKYNFLNISSINKSLRKIGVSRLALILFLLVLLSAAMFKLPLARESKASLVMITKDEERFFEGTVVEGMTVLEALYVSSEAGDIPFKYTIKDDAVNITVINGKSDPGVMGNLRFFLNSALIDESQIHKIKVQPGDKIEIRAK